MNALSSLPADTLTILPWPDPVIDRLGHDPRSWYVETYWLGILGPSTTWLLRRVAAGFDARPDGFDLPLADTARCLGLGDKGGRHSPFSRALTRCVQFDLAQPQGDGVLGVRRMLPPLNRRQALRLPESLRAAHESWQEAQLRTPPVEEMRRRAGRLALSLLELGEDTEAAERQLMRWRFHPSLATEAVAWARERHRRAAEEAAGTAPAEPAPGLLAASAGGGTG